jgi:alpha-glucosidase
MNRLLKYRPNDTEAQKIAREEYQKKSRDNGRTPVQWSAAPNGGFTGPNVKPWMSVNPNFARGINAEDQVNDSKSTYNFWASVLALRKRYLDLFVYGNYELVDRDSQEVFAYSRQYENQKALILANWTDRTLDWDPSANGVHGVKDVLLNTYDNMSDVKERFSASKWSLRPYEAVVLHIEA